MFCRGRFTGIESRGFHQRNSLGLGDGRDGLVVSVLEAEAVLGFCLGLRFFFVRFLLIGNFLALLLGFLIGNSVVSVLLFFLFFEAMASKSTS